MATGKWARLCAGYFYTNIGTVHVVASQNADGWELRFEEESPNSYHTKSVQCKTLEEAQSVAAAWNGF